MSIEVKPWDSAELLHDERDLAMFLAVSLEEDDGPTIYASSMRVAAKARGGVATLARESGVPEPELSAGMQGSEEEALPVIQKLAAAYSRLSAGRLVA